MDLFLIMGILGAAVAAGGLLSDGGSDGDDTPDDVGHEMDGSAEADFLTGGAGADTVWGGPGTDLVIGRGGDDLMRGGAEEDVVVGGAGNDTLQGNEGYDVLFGGAGDDHLAGGAEEDDLFGGTGRDLLEGGLGADILDGLDLPDTLDPKDAVLRDHFAEVWNMDASTEGVAALETDLATVLGTKVAGQGQLISDEILSHGPADAAGTGDTLLGGWGSDTLYGDSGDMLTGGGSYDSYVISALRADHAYTAEDYQPVQITDYQRGEDVMMHHRADAPPVITFTQTGANIEVQLDGRTVVVLQNKVMDQIETRNFYTAPIPGLAA